MSKFAVLGIALGAAVCGIGAAPEARALALPDAVGTATCGVTGAQNIVDPVACAAAYDHASISLGPTPTLVASGDYPGGGAFLNASANAVLTYNFAVIGGQAGDRVHLDIATLLHAAFQGSPNSYVFSRVIVTTNLGEVTANICSLNCGAGTGVTDFKGALHVDAMSGMLNTVYMDVYATAAAGPNAGSANASADPIISIDHTTPNFGDYSLLFSHGVGNGGVPEPATWTLMLAGLGLAGARLRRRARLAPTAASVRRA